MTQAAKTIAFVQALKFKGCKVQGSRSMKTAKTPLLSIKTKKMGKAKTPVSWAQIQVLATWNAAKEAFVLKGEVVYFGASKVEVSRSRSKKLGSPEEAAQYVEDKRNDLA